MGWKVSGFGGGITGLCSGFLTFLGQCLYKMWEVGAILVLCPLSVFLPESAVFFTAVRCYGTGEMIVRPCHVVVETCTL